MRINYLTTNGKVAVICQQILSTDSIRKSMEVSVENLYVDTGD